MRLWSIPWVAYAACLCTLVYGAMKVYMAAIGHIGLPGFPAPADVSATYDHIVLRQLGLAATAVIATMIPLAIVRSWDRIVPRWLLLIAVWSGFVLLGAGSTVFFLRAFQITDAFGPHPMDWTGFVVVGFLVVLAGLWGATAWHYQRRSRDRVSR